MNNKIILYFLLVLVSILFISCSAKKTLPDSFTIKFYSSGGSSGQGTGNFSASLSFVEGKLVNGSSSYTYLGRQSQTFEKCNLDVVDLKWQAIRTEENCSSTEMMIPFTIKELEGLMNAPPEEKHITEMKECGHNDLCYEII